MYLDVAGETTVTESRQQDDMIRDPLEAAESTLDEEISEYVRDDGLADALDGVESNGSE